MSISQGKYLFGIITSIITFIIMISGLILLILHYEYTNFNWTSQFYYRNLSILNLTSIIFTFINSINLFFSFYFFNISTIIFNIIISIIFTIFNIIISILNLTASNIKENSSTNLCQKNLTGIFSDFNILDNYFHLVDEYLCSYDCPCILINQSAYEDFHDFTIIKNHSQIVYDQFKYMNVTFDLNDDFSKAKSFKDCSRTIQGLAKMHFLKDKKILEKIDTFKIDNFYKFWGKIEKKFHCTGWCNNYYISQKNSSEENVRFITKYLFSDINGGVVKNIGCMHRIIDWLPKIIFYFGCLLLISNLLIILPFFSIFFNIQQNINSPIENIE